MPTTTTVPVVLLDAEDESLFDYREVCRLVGIDPDSPDGENVFYNTVFKMII